MTTPAKRKGSQYERDVVKWLISMGYPCAERAYGAGRHDDVGDIDGIDGVVIECKNEKKFNIPGYLKKLVGTYQELPADMMYILILNQVNIFQFHVINS